MNNNAKNFDNRLQTLLTISGMTRKELADRLRVTVPVVSRWCNGVSVPDVYQFREIARIFGMPYEWFLDDGATFLGVEDMAVVLGLSEDTVQELLSLADTAGDSLMSAVDDAVYAVISAVNTASDDLLNTAGKPAGNLK